MLGDSIADGYGADPTGDGSNGLAYGGAAVPAGVTMIDDGVSQATWQDSAGTAPDPGYLPHIAETFLAAGYSSVRLIRYAVQGSPTSTVRASFFAQAVNYCATNGITPHVCLLATGTNDANDASEAAAFGTLAPIFANEIEAAWPSVRLGWFQPVSNGSGAHPNTSDVQGHITTTCAIKASRFAISHSGVSVHDLIHPDLTGYRTQGRRAITGYQSAA